MVSLRNLQKQLQQLDRNLRAAFSNLRNDISRHTERLEHMEVRIAKLEDITKKRMEYNTSTEKPKAHPKVFASRSVRSVKRSVSVRQTPNSLTALQSEILKRLMVLQMESGKRAISMRDLAAEVYPTKEYANIKSTLSEHISKLHRARLVEKISSGKLYLSYTELALQYADQQRLSRMKELISEPLTVR